MASDDVLYEVGDDYPTEQPEIINLENIDADNIIIRGDLAVFRKGYNVVMEIPLVDLGEIQNTGD